MEPPTSQEHPVKRQSQEQRPAVIAVICILGFISTAFRIPLIFSDIAAQVGNWYPPYLVFSGLVGLACFAGLWMMKKWAVYAYATYVVLTHVVLLVMGVWNVMALLSIVIVVIAYKYIDRMD
jgi:glycerol-3-phosphate acyltransferase PlsY